MKRRRVALLLFIALLLIVNIAAYYALSSLQDKQTLRVTFLNVGQGDSILIETPSGAEVLIDGGPDRSVLRELPKVIGPLDRSLDLVIATHPDKDHIAGLSEVFKRYDVKAFMEPGVPYDTSYAKALDEGVREEKGVEHLYARRGMRIHLGSGAYADVLFPDRAVPGVETNTGSIVLRLVYGETEFLLSGDAPSSIEEWLVALSGEELQSDVLKAGHHGSRTSTSQSWIDAVDPRYVVVSAGRDNSYGHPHKEVVERVGLSGATLLSTFDGPVRFESDRESIVIK